MTTERTTLGLPSWALLQETKWKNATLIFRLAVVLILSLFSNTIQAEGHAPKKPGRNLVKLPRLMADFEKRCFDPDAPICPNKDFLELIACTSGCNKHDLMCCGVREADANSHGVACLPLYERQSSQGPVASAPGISLVGRHKWYLLKSEQ